MINNNIHHRLQKATTIGIWGFGITGKSLLQFFSQLYPHAKIIIYSKDISEENKNSIAAHKATIIDNDNISLFLEQSDIIIPSPGIALTDTHGKAIYPTIQHKYLHELDIFAYFWQGKTIALTGSIGKTSTVHLIDHVMCQNNIQTNLAGNVGYPLANLLCTKNNAEQYAIAELSSFQLEHYTQDLNSQVAILTNILPNHLDRHHTIEAYRRAKYSIFKNIPHSSHIVVPVSEYEHIVQTAIIDHPGLTFFTTKQEEVNNYNLSIPLFFFDTQTNQICIKTKDCNKKILYTLPTRYASFAENWLIALATCYLSDLPLNTISTENPHLPGHRLDAIAKTNSITFYNDSKSTIIQATYAAIQKTLADHPYTIVLLGGTGKGVDRAHYVQDFAHHKKNLYIIVFGLEREQLYSACKQFDIPAYSTEFLTDAFAHALTIADKKDNSAILFSPGGASFDQFANYQERGNAFINLVKEFIDAKKANNIITKS